MTTTTATPWTRDGETFVNSGELSGMDAPPWGEEIDGDYYTAYYRKGTEARAASTYYVVRVLTENQPVVRTAWVVEERTWVGDVDADDSPINEDYSDEGGSALFYDTPAVAHNVARRMADEDESYAFL